MSFLFSSMFFLIDKIEDLKSHPFTTLHLNPGCFMLFQDVSTSCGRHSQYSTFGSLYKVCTSSGLSSGPSFEELRVRRSGANTWLPITARFGTLKLSTIPRARPEMKSTHTTRGADVWRLPGTNDRINPTNAGSKILVFSVNECKWVPGRLHHITPQDMETCP